MAVAKLLIQGLQFYVETCVFFVKCFLFKVLCFFYNFHVSSRKGTPLNAFQG